MARRHDLEIEIAPDGQVQVHVKGAKGKECLQYVEMFQAFGEVTDQRLTSEYYEPGVPVEMTEHSETRIKR